MSELLLNIPGCVRSKKNSKRIFARGNRAIVLPSESYEAWKTDAQKWCMLQIDRQFKPLNEPLEVSALIYYKGRRPDLDNALSAIADCFQGLLWIDDNLIMSYDGSRLYKDNDNPRVELRVRW